MRSLSLIIVSLSLSLSLAGCRFVDAPIPPSTQGGSGDIVSDTEADFLPETPVLTPESLEVAPTTELLQTTLTASGTILIGSLEAPRLTIVTDPACVYCQEFTLEDQAWLEQTYVSTKKLALEIVYLPTDAVGKLNAKALLCSVEQNRFAEMNHVIAISPAKTEAELLTQAKSLKIPSAVYVACLRSQATAVLLDAHASIATSIGVTRVPSFQLGTILWMGRESRVHLQSIIEGAL